ncbi:hypothetical protein C7212DRAFT_324651, partial [Tuber magnatum]
RAVVSFSPPAVLGGFTLFLLLLPSHLPHLQPHPKSEWKQLIRDGEKRGGIQTGIGKATPFKLVTCGFFTILLLSPLGPSSLQRVSEIILHDM